MGLSDAEAEAAGKLMDVLESMGIEELPTDEEAFGARVLAGPLLGDFSSLCARVVGLVAAAEPAAGLVALERKNEALFIDSLVAALWKLDCPHAAHLKPSAAAALAAPAARQMVLEFLAGEAAAARINSAEGFDPAAPGAVLQRLGAALDSPAASASLQALEAEVKRLVAGLPPGYLGETLVEEGRLGEEGVALLRRINAGLKDDYATRRKLLLQRFEVRPHPTPPHFASADKGWTWCAGDASVVPVEQEGPERGPRRGAPSRDRAVQSRLHLPTRRDRPRPSLGRTL